MLMALALDALRWLEEKMRKQNRWNSRKPRGKSFWCWSCDGGKVWNGGRCPNCGKKDSGKRMRP
jgi:hypothetical protein